MAKQNKTVETKETVAAFIKKIKDEKRRKDFATVVEMMKKQTKLDPKMWGTAIVGYGSYHYKYESGREGDAPLIGLASRANAITLYIGDFEKKEELLSKLGKHKIGGGCLHIQKLENIELSILNKIIQLSFTHKKKEHKC